MDRINREAYLAYSYALKPDELRIMGELLSWLPDEIIDAHAHCNRAEHVLEIDDKTYHHMGSSFPYFDLEESEYLHQTIFPGKQVRTLRFAMPYKEIDHVQANDYLLANSNTTDRIALYSPPNAIGYACEMLAHPRVSALKMYYKAVIPWATRIYDYFPPDVLAVAEQLDVPLVLNLPTVITKCREDLGQLVTDFPNLRIAIAHLGSSKFLIPELRESYEEFAKYPNMFMDTAMNPSCDVVRMALEVFGADRVMYGSDEPICLVRSIPYVHPTLGQRIVTEYPYHWANPVEHEEFKHLANGAVHALWQSLLAIKDALTSFSSKTQESLKARIFHRNARGFYGF